MLGRYRGTVLVVVLGFVGVLLLSSPGSFGDGATPSHRPGPPPGPVAVGPRVASVLLHGAVRAAEPGPSGFRSAPDAGWLSYDAAVGDFLVPDPPQNVDAVRLVGGTPELAAGIHVGADPFQVAVDNATGAVFVTNFGSSNVSVLGVDPLRIEGSVAVGPEPTGVAVDPGNGEVFVALQGSDEVAVIDESSLSVIARIPVGSAPTGIAYDPANARVMVADTGSDEVSVLSATGLRAIANVSVGASPYGVAIDSATGRTYVTDSGSGNVSVLSADGTSVVANVAVAVPADPAGGFGGPAASLQGLAYDPDDRDVWIGAGSFYTVVVNTSSEAVLGYIDVDPSGVAFDPGTGDVCLTNTANVSFACFEFPGTPDTTAATLVTVTETGLPSGTDWSVELGSDGPFANSSTASIRLGLPRGLVSYTVLPVDGYAPETAGGLLNVSSSPSTAVVTYSYDPDRYTVAFAEVGLPAGTSWSVDLAGSVLQSTTAAISVAEQTGTYRYTLGIVPGWRLDAGERTGIVSVDAADVEVPAFSFAPNEFVVNFTESGLPPGTPWTVDIGGASPSSDVGWIAVAEPNGTYSYEVAPVPGYSAEENGTVTVAGAAVAVPVGFSPTYLVTFGETGLAPGAPWNVTLGSTLRATTASEIVFSLPDGTYPFATAAEGYFAAPPTGTVVVAGAALTQGISFAPVPTGEYPVTFGERGLPAGIGWSVTVENGSRSVDVTVGAVAPDPIVAELANGSYTWGVFVPAGYSVVVPSGSLVVAGPSQGTTSVTYSPTGTISPHSPATPTFSTGVLAGTAAIAGAVGLSVGLWVRRRRNPPRSVSA